MKLIKFPGLNLEFNISRVAFKVFGIEVYWYAIIIVTAMIIALLIYKKRDGLYEIKFDDILDISLFVIPISIICARLYYVLFNLNYYIQNPSDLLNFRSGGIAIYGAVIGGIITCLIFCKKRRINLLNFMDYIAPGIVLGQAIGRWGNFVNVEAHGVETNFIFRMGIIEAGNYIEVHPTFFYESLACFLIFIILLIIKNKRFFNGQITCTYFLLYSLERTFVEGLRTDSLMIGKARVSQVLSIIIFLVCIGIYSYQIKKKINNRYS